MTGQTIWPDKFGVSFHACVGRLYKHRRIISDAQTYEYSPEADQGQGHTLSFRDELKMADDLAILARKDHHGTISAVTLKEAEDGLVVVLASNEAPRRDIVRGLGALFNIISAISTEDMSAEKAYIILFERILQLGREKIVHLVQPSQKNVKTPKPPFRIRLSKMLTETVLCSTPDEFRTQFQKVLEALQELEDTLEDRPKVGGVQDAMAAVVTQCAILTRIGGARSFKVNLKTLGLPSEIRESNIVSRVDTLAQYHYICRDLIKYARNPAYKRLLGNMTLETLPAYSAGPRPGLPQSCRCTVHAEAQQILHYEQHPFNPPPRAIGSNKRACYLCDLLIREHGKYRITGTHGKLYETWTLPDVDWMTAAQKKAFRRIISSMMLRIQGQMKSTLPHREDPAESVAAVPTPTESVNETPKASDIGAAKSPGVETPKASEIDTPRASPKASEINIPRASSRAAGIVTPKASALQTPKISSLGAPTESGIETPKAVSAKTVRLRVPSATSSDATVTPAQQPTPPPDPTPAPALVPVPAAEPAPASQSRKRQRLAPQTISAADLPFKTDIGIGKVPIHLEIEQKLRLFFEFDSVAVGSLTIRRKRPSRGTSRLCMEASEIAMEDVCVPAGSETEKVIHIRHGSSLILEITFSWRN